MIRAKTAGIAIAAALGGEAAQLALTEIMDGRAVAEDRAAWVDMDRIAAEYHRRT